jgi:hypothetical protein
VHSEEARPATVSNQASRILELPVDHQLEQEAKKVENLMQEYFAQMLGSEDLFDAEVIFKAEVSFDGVAGEKV